ncbi:hypothetical protein KIW84_050221 [Lathyrus oleraceus]|uniref:Reverse transcriptase domain-containing protein n=1 Tax=Pisum sativum TaxID=3888 RepID=A0A9D5AC43_PEA|nr:hypothetical protein KIW84_050221 [Pisum sativum]
MICFVPTSKKNSPDLIDNNLVTPSYDFDNPIYHAEEEGEEDCDLLELARLLKQKEKVIQPHEERVEIVIPSTAEDMPGSDIGVVAHKLPWKGDCPLEEQNAGATYQRAMVTLFHDMIHHEIECYVDDMIAKSQNRRGASGGSDQAEWTG